MDYVMFKYFTANNNIAYGLLQYYEFKSFTRLQSGRTILCKTIILTKYPIFNAYKTLLK